MSKTEENERRMLHLALQLAVVHIGDHDLLGRMARELEALLLARDPTLADLPCDREEWEIEEERTGADAARALAEYAEGR
jgi:hypothetical protein